MSKSFHLGQLFRDKRLAKGLSQLEVSRHLGYSSSQFVSNWERGLCLPPTNSLPVLCDLLGISKNQVVKLLLEEYRQELESVMKPTEKAE